MAWVEQRGFVRKIDGPSSFDSTTDTIKKKWDLGRSRKGEREMLRQLGQIYFVLGEGMLDSMMTGEKMRGIGKIFVLEYFEIETFDFEEFKFKFDEVMC